MQIDEAKIDPTAQRGEERQVILRGCFVPVPQAMQRHSGSWKQVAEQAIRDREDAAATPASIIR